MKTRLYKLTTTGATQFWEIEVKGDSFRTTTGKLDGKEHTNQWTVCNPKNDGKANETSGAEQALKEVASKIQRKREKGYSDNVIDAGRPEYFEPMLAKKWKDRKGKVEFPVFSQPKLDGIRCTLTADKAESRNGKPFFTIPHIQKQLEYIFKKYPNLKLDGELYNHEFKENFNKISSLVKKQKPTEEDLKESAELVEYHIYDCSDGLSKIFSERQDYMSELKGQSIVVVETTYIRTESDLDDLYDHYLELGYEGQMVRIDEVYENKRSNFLLKRKDFMDEEFTIIDIEEGKGNRAGKAKNMTFEKNGRQFSANVKGTWEWMAQCLKDRRKLIGKEATVNFFRYTPDGVPRFGFVTKIRDYE